MPVVGRELRADQHQQRRPLGRDPHARVLDAGEGRRRVDVGVIGEHDEVEARLVRRRQNVLERRVAVVRRRVVDVNDADQSRQQKRGPTSRGTHHARAGR